MSQEPEPRGPLSPEALRYYESYQERERLYSLSGSIERQRTQEIVTRYISPSPGTILDIGGGPGVHAFWLAEQGYSVHLLDAVPLHIEQARQKAQEHPNISLASITVGDACHLPFADASADAVLLLGPLYHLVEREERLMALREVRRVLRPGGWLFAAAISRFASLFEGLFLKPYLLTQSSYADIVRQDVVSGQHRNPTAETTLFTTTYFHHPSELQAELVDAGLFHETTIGVEGPLWLARDFIPHYQDEQTRERVSALLRQIEQDEALLGISAHLLAVGRKE